LLVLGAMIFVHELGHFLVAKWLGIRVEVFSLGFGKRLIGFRRGDTDYRLSLLPLGGYVKMAGDNIGEDRAGAPDEFLSHSKWHRFLVAIAGPAMNILTAFAIPFAASMIYFAVPAYKTEPVVVASVKPESTAAKAGLQPGDRIVEFNGTQVETWRDFEDHVLLSPGQNASLVVERGGQRTNLAAEIETDDIGGEKIGALRIQPELPGVAIQVVRVVDGQPAQAAGMKVGDKIVAVNDAPVGADLAGLIHTINRHPGQPLKVTIERDGQLSDLTATPALEDGVGRLGFQPNWTNIPMNTTPLGAVDAAKYSYDTNMRFLRLTGAAFMQIFKGQRSASGVLAGPIGIAEIVGQAAEQGIGPVFELMGLLSLNLGIFNLLPIPVLDGGLIFMLGLEAVLGWFGRSLSLGVKEKMINVGLVLIVLLMGFVIFNDIRKKIVSSSAESPPPAQQQQPKPAEPPPVAPAVPVK
jgi:regulator of sigma E protease